MRVAHLLPRQRGNVAVDNYRFVNALLWMCRTGAPWRDLPECYGKWITVCRRFNRWSGNGAMERLFAALQEERIIGVEIRVLAMDSTSVKVHQHATGAPKKGGRSQSASPGEGGTPKSAWHPTAGARSSRSIRARATSTTRPMAAPGALTP
ncbi:MAG: transposase [Bifidobacterium sp.]